VAGQFSESGQPPRVVRHRHVALGCDVRGVGTQVDRHGALLVPRKGLTKGLGVDDLTSAVALRAHISRFLPRCDRSD
jgi:hypothetical protein